MGTRVLIADDHQVLRQGLRTMLEKEPGIEVIGEADNGRSACKLAEELAPEVVIMDVAMPDMNGIEATKQILAIFPKTKIIALSMHDDRRFVLNMFKMGASAYLLKNCAFREIVKAIQTVMANRTYLSIGITDLVVEGYVASSLSAESSVYMLLSPREREVLQLIAEGKTTNQIAARLYVSSKTIETHRNQIMRKLNINSIAGLTKYALSEGLTSMEISHVS